MSIFNKAEKDPSQVIVENVLKIKKNETVLIIANPETNQIAQDIFTQILKAGAKPSLIYQTKKNSDENAEKSVIYALKSEPDVCLSISCNKLGRDEEGIANPYTAEDGKTYTDIFDYLIYGKKTMRAIWTPGITEEIYGRSVAIDYKLLQDRCAKLSHKLNKAVKVHVTSPNGTDIFVNIQNREAFCDDGNYGTAGKGGNIPAGEVFISPQIGILNAAEKTEVITEKSEDKGQDKIQEEQTTPAVSEPAEKTLKALKDAKDFIEKTVEEVKTELHIEQPKDKISETETNSNGVENSGSKNLTEGTIVFDGSITMNEGDVLLATPITVKIEDGYVKEISGGDESKKLLKDISQAEKESLTLEADGKLPEGMGKIYERNARAIGELGIGLNPNATVSGNMLEDEKAFRTCHFAIGENYDGDAPSLIHYDGIVRNPTITLIYEDGTEEIVLNVGELVL